ncbi:hypothetical protein DRQ32_01880 [bacterium]|nr:MAG: hypothetical protein DRQ32_01880 [bacterium]
MSATRSRRKIVLRVVLALAALFVLALVLIPVLVPAERWQQIAFDRLEAETGLVATAESVGVSVVPLGLRLSGLQVRDPQNRPEWSGLELDLEEAVVQASLKPLFSGRFEAGEVTLKRPHVVLTPAAADTDSDASGTGAGTQAGGSTAAPAVSIALAAVSVEDAYIEINQPDGSRIVLHGLSNLSALHIDGANGEASANGQLDSVVFKAPDLPAETVRGLHWKLDSEFAADGSQGSLHLEELGLPGLDGKGDISWTTAELTSVDARLDLQADVAALSREWFEPRRGEIEWPEGVDPSDFGDFAGSFTGELSFKGPIDPEATPEEQAELVQLTGRIEGLGGRILGREDLARVDADISFSAGNLQLKSMQIATPAGTLSGSYTAQPLTDNDARLDLSGGLNTAAARDLAAAMWPQLAPLAGEDATGPDEWPQVAGELQLQLGMDIPSAPDAEPRLAWSATAATLTLRPVDIEADFVLSDLQLSGDAINIAWTAGDLSGPGVDLTPRLDIALGEELTRVNGQVHARLLDLDELQAHLAPPLETARASWFVGEARAAEEMWTPPADLAANLEFSADEVRVSGHRLTGVTGHAKLEGQQLNVSSVRAALGAGRIDAVADVDYRQEPPVFDAKVQVANVPAAVLLAPDAPKLAGALQTDFSGDFSFEGPLSSDPEAAMRALSGEISLVAAAGALQTEPVLGTEISKFMGEYAPKWQRLAFSALDAQLRVEAGQVYFDRLLIEGDTRVRADGKVSLDGRCDYRLDVLLPPQATPDVGSLQPVVDLLRDEDGNLPFSVKVTGPAAKPKVGIDFDALKDRAEQRGREEIGDAVEDAVKDLWGKLKGGN